MLTLLEVFLQLAISNCFSLFSSGESPPTSGSTTDLHRIGSRPAHSFVRPRKTVPNTVSINTGSKYWEFHCIVEIEKQSCFFNLRSLRSLMNVRGKENP